MSEYIAKSVLAEHAGQQGVRAEFKGVEISELPIMDHFNIRLQADDSELLKLLETTLGFEVPLKPNTFVIHENNLCAWLGPDEWLIIAQLDQSDQIEQKLVDILAGKFATMTKLSSAQTIIRVAGPRSAELLSRGIALDLDPSRFKFGQCAQTILAHTNITVLNHTQNEPLLDVIVRRSFADHLWLWLQDVGQEAEFSR